MWPGHVAANPRGLGAAGPAGAVMTTPPDLSRDLRAAGLPISDLWELVNAETQFKAAIPVLIDWLRNVEWRAPQGPDQASVREGLVRALSVPAGAADDRLGIGPVKGSPGGTAARRPSG